MKQRSKEEENIKTAIKSRGWREITAKSGAGATREDQCVTVIWLQGRTCKQQIAVCRVPEVLSFFPFFAPLSFWQLFPRLLAQVAQPLI